MKVNRSWNNAKAMSTPFWILKFATRLVDCGRASSSFASVRSAEIAALRSKHKWWRKCDKFAYRLVSVAVKLEMKLLLILAHDVVIVRVFRPSRTLRSDDRGDQSRSAFSSQEFVRCWTRLEKKWEARKCHVIVSDCAVLPLDA